jgi:hypothetical protein
VPAIAPSTSTTRSKGRRLLPLLLPKRDLEDFWALTAFR